MTDLKNPRRGRRAQAEATRGRLLEAAMAAFMARPYDEVAVSEIADAAGTARGLPFHYFGSKRGLYLEALRVAARQLRAAHQVSDDGTPRERVKAMLTAHFTFMRRHASLAVALLRGGIGADAEAWQIFETSRIEAIRWICEVLELDPEPRAVSVMLRAIVGAIDEATIQWMHRQRAVPLATLVDALLAMLVSAIEGAMRLDPALDARKALKHLRRPAR